MSPRLAALPISETLSGPKYSGKMVMMSIRTFASRLDSSSRARHPAGFGLESGVRVEQAGRRVDLQLTSGDINDGDDGGDERDHDLRPGPRAGAAHQQQVLAMVQHISHLTNRL